MDFRAVPANSEPYNRRLWKASIIVHSPTTRPLLSGREPPDEVGFRSGRLQIWFNHSDEGWVDPGPHAHLESDSCFVVFTGSLVLEVEGERITVGPREFCCLAAGLAYAVVEVHAPVETLTIRAPAVEDKVWRQSQQGLLEA